MNPVSIPVSAAAFENLEQMSGWTKDASVPGITPHAPKSFEIVQATPPPIQPPMTMTLKTTGVQGEYCGWMAKAPTLKVPAGALNCLLRATFTLVSVKGMQALEIGRRATDQHGITDNGQINLVPTTDGKIAVWIVPGPNGGWLDTGIRFPMPQPGVANSLEFYWLKTAAGALSLIYAMLNGSLQTVSSKFQNIEGVAMTPEWELNSAVVGAQPDTNQSGIPFDIDPIEISVWFW